MTHGSENQEFRLDLSDATAASPRRNLAHWVGYEGFVRHTKMSFRSAALEGDVTYLDAAVTGKQSGSKTVSLEVTMSNQHGTVLGTGSADVELPNN